MNLGLENSTFQHNSNNYFLFYGVNNNEHLFLSWTHAKLNNMWHVITRNADKMYKFFVILVMRYTGVKKRCWNWPWSKFSQLELFLFDCSWSVHFLLVNFWFSLHVWAFSFWLTFLYLSRYEMILAACVSFFFLIVRASCISFSLTLDSRCMYELFLSDWPFYIKAFLVYPLSLRSFFIWFSPLFLHMW